MPTPDQQYKHVRFEPPTESQIEQCIHYAISDSNGQRIGYLLYSISDGYTTGEYEFSGNATTSQLSEITHFMSQLRKDGDNG